MYVYVCVFLLQAHVYEDGKDPTLFILNHRRNIMIFKAPLTLPPSNAYIHTF